MAGAAKPNVKGLKKEGKITLISSFVRVHHGSFNVSNDVSALFDGEIMKRCYGEVLFTSISYIEFKCDKKIKLWGISSNTYSDSGGSTPTPMIIKKWNGTSYVDIDERPTYNNNAWYELTGELEKGQYKIQAKKDYVSLDELYVENLQNEKYLIKKDNQYYTITKNYSNGKFIPLTLQGGKQPNRDDYEKFGFDDLSKLTIVKDKTMIDGVDKNNVSEGKIVEFKLIDEIKKINNISNDANLDLYSSPFSKGDRQKLIKVTCTDGLTKGGNVIDLLNGKTDNSFYFYGNKTSQWMLFEFQEPVCIQELNWYQNNESEHGKWQLQGSNDNIVFNKLGELFTLTKGKFNISNNNKYKYYKLQQLEGNTSGSPWLYEIEFGINPSTLRYLISYDKQLHTLCKNTMMLSPSQELTTDNFKTNGFDNPTVITEQQWHDVFKDNKDLKLLMWTDDLNVKNAKLEYNCKPCRPIDVLREQLGNEFQMLVMKEIN